MPKTTVLNSTILVLIPVRFTAVSRYTGIRYTGIGSPNRDTVLVIWHRHVPYVVVFVFLEFVDT